MAFCPTLLARLWLHEPDTEALALAQEVESLAPHLTDPTELAMAYTDLFLLNVYPYASVFLNSDGELNDPAAQQLATLYEAHGYQPPELSQVGAPDHLGLCLGFQAYVEQDGILPHDFLAWAPVCCLAVEREPSAHPFYRALAVLTREGSMTEILSREVRPDRSLRPFTSFRASSVRSTELEEEVHLRDVVRFFLAPAQCGIFLSRGRLGQTAKTLGMYLPFGSRFEVAERLFTAAGEGGQVAEVLQVLRAEVEEWAATYRAWAAAYPAWMPYADAWLERIESARHVLAGMVKILESPLDAS